MEDSAADGNLKAALTLALMAKIQPEWTDREAHAALSKGFLLENPFSDESSRFDKDLVLDVVTVQESKEIVEHNNQVQEAVQKKRDFLAKRTQWVSSHFTKHKVPQAKRARKTPPRWLPKPSEDTGPVTEHVRKHLPAGATVLQDDYNGRWFVNYPSKRSVSISWTKRGYAAAAAHAIHTAWRLHGEVSGEEPSWPLAALGKDFEVSQVT